MSITWNTVRFNNVTILQIDEILFILIGDHIFIVVTKSIHFGRLVLVYTSLLLFILVILRFIKAKSWLELGQYLIGEYPISFAGGSICHRAIVRFRVGRLVRVEAKARQERDLPLALLQPLARDLLAVRQSFRYREQSLVVRGSSELGFMPINRYPLYAFYMFLLIRCLYRPLFNASNLYLNIVWRSLSISSFFVLRSPWALNADTIDVYASNSSKYIKVKVRELFK